jgi:tetratricopeptide (TPR) repeat protein
VTARRQELHRRAADALQRLYPERVRELAPVLAYHYQEGEVWQEAARHAAVAAGLARRAYANQEALARFDQALAATERAGSPDRERLALREARAELYAHLGDFDRAKDDLETALALAEAGRDAPARGRVLGTLGALWGGHRDYARGLTLTRESVAALEGGDDRRALAEARVRLGVLLLNVARVTESRRELESARRLFEELGDELGEVRTLDVLGMSAALAGDTERGMEHATEAARRLEALGDPAAAVSPMITVGICEGHFGGYRAGEPVMRRAVALAQASGARSDESFAHAALAQIALPCGHYGLALREATAALEIARALDHREWTGMALSMLGRARLGCGDAAGALRLHEDFRDIAENLGTALWLGEARANLAEDLIALGRTAEADVLLADAVAGLRDLAFYVVHSVTLRAELQLGAGDARAAMTTARAAIALAPALRVWVEDARRVEGEALAIIEGPDAGLAVLADAERGAEAIGVAPVRWRAALAQSRLLGEMGRSAESRAAAARALAALETAALEIEDPVLRRSFESSQSMARARASATGIRL